MSKNLKKQIILVEMLLEALKEYDSLLSADPGYVYSPLRARVERLRVESYKELTKWLKKY